MVNTPRMTIPTQLVLRAFLEHPTREMYGLEICRAAGLPSGTIHPILARLESTGWLQSRWEEIDPHDAGRPRRRFYRLSPEGAERARHELARRQAPARLVRPAHPPRLAHQGGVT